MRSRPWAHKLHRLARPAASFFRVSWAQMHILVRDYLGRVMPYQPVACGAFGYPDPRRHRLPVQNDCWQDRHGRTRLVRVALSVPIRCGADAAVRNAGSRDVEGVQWDGRAAGHSPGADVRRGGMRGDVEDAMC